MNKLSMHRLTSSGKCEPCENYPSNACHQNAQPSPVIAGERSSEISGCGSRSKRSACQPVPFCTAGLAFLRLQTGSPEYGVQKFLKNQVPGGWWSDHTASWWALRDKSNVHIETFNDLKADSSAAIDRISGLLGVELSPEQRQHVLEKSSFDYMKAIDHRFSPIIGNTDMPVIVRKGQTGTGSELFTEEQLASIDAFCKRELERLGSDFPYD